jgi:hypothetical protein
MKSSKFLASRVAGLVTAGAAPSMPGTAPAQAATWTSGSVSWSASGELIRITDTKADGYSFGVTAADTKVPNVVAVCGVTAGTGHSKSCDLSYPEGRSILIVASRQKGGTIEPGGSATVRS